MEVIKKKNARKEIKEKNWWEPTETRRKYKIKKD